MISSMALVLVLCVTWVTTALVVVGACVAAGRADRVAGEAVSGPAPLPGVVREYSATVALQSGAMGASRRAERRSGPAPRRGAGHTDRGVRATRR